MSEKDPTGKSPLRRCIVTGEILPKEEMIRFVFSPADEIVPDLENSLPGRGFWLSARADVLKTAQMEKYFSRAARKKTAVPADLFLRVETLLVKRCQNLLGLSDKAGQIVTGFEKVLAALKKPKKPVFLLQALDAGDDGKHKMSAHLPAETPSLAVLTGDELGEALGRTRAVHILLYPGGLAKRLKLELKRLSALRSDK